MAIEVRELDRVNDRRAVEAIDTTFETDTIFDLKTEARRIELVERRLASPLLKRYPMTEVFQPWASWKHAWVADDGAVRGFAAVEYEAWHQRLVLWFLYVSPEYRKQGVGRALLERVETFARARAASHVWLETSNVNVPGVRAYERMGYALCGADTRYYGSYMPNETALYMAKSIDVIG